MHFDNALGNSQAEPGTPLFASAAVVRLLKFFKDLLLIVEGNSRSGIRNRHGKCPVGDRDLDADFAAVGEFDGVAHQVQKDLGEALGIAFTGRHMGRHGNIEGEMFFRGERFDSGKRGLHDVEHIVVGDRKHQAPGFDAGQIQHRIDQAEKMLAALLHTS